MDASAFEARLRAEGYAEIVTNTVAGPKETPVHTHPFDAFAMIVAGEMSVVCGEDVQACRVGDTFRLEAGQEHLERYGAQGATYLVGRRRVEAKAA